jgi:ribose 5-phosphate isomerase A
VRLVPGSTDPHAAAKDLAGRHAATYVEDGMRVGLGTGSTVHFTIVALGERKPDITCVATSRATEELATSLGLRVVPPGDLDALDIAIDGADQVDPDLNLVKGGGGAHTREKIVASMTGRFIVVVDDAKLVERIHGGIPLEVVAFGEAFVIGRVEQLGAAGVTRRSALSDNGNPILDASFPPVDDPAGFGRELSGIPGLVEHGIFPATMVERVVVAGETVRELERP